jgi:hypothetical protein
MTSFSSLVERIELAYVRLGHELGWRFLYSPAATLDRRARLALVGLNPGGGCYHAPAPSVEAGNAYRLERWATNGGLNTLQIQVRRLYEELAVQLEEPSAVQLMDETLTANFCPFRSPSWQSLSNRDRSVEFSGELWSAVLGIAEPAAVICLGELAARHIGGALERRGARQHSSPHIRRVGWGPVTYELTRYQSSRARTLVVRLPHLSRFAFFGRPASRAAVEELMTAVAASAKAA